MANLPDELLSAILAPSFAVAHSRFADTSTSSPFATASASLPASRLLLVCKRFMRVASPYLYETVVIRSPSQAEAFKLALSRAPELARFVRKLRLEGAYGRFLVPKIMGAMSAVTHLCFTLSVDAGEKLEGLYKAFNAMNPTHVYLWMSSGRKVGSPRYQALVKSFCAAIPKWTKLEHFSFEGLAQSLSDGGGLRTHWHFSDDLGIAIALAKCPALRTVDAWPNFYIDGTEVALKHILRNTSVRVTLHSRYPADSPTYPYMAAFSSEEGERVILSNPYRSLWLSQVGTIGP
ncbi:hypothetical protein EXIGLDRAFT_830636 [Exidia glandulosa HHB12029]|uniref:Uncharacterized protein n=1 Tax=Exidia glandulosa HHB12029 TaxID=1314781 RepID=A0A165NAQ8_EXIGL|nr:hypothetical protein EXIGLDRAFT_830636 [Exidia glandulosa HHB12029]